MASWGGSPPPLCRPFHWDAARRYDRGKVLTREDSDAGRKPERYKDVDGQAPAWPPLPGHPPRNAASLHPAARAQAPPLPRPLARAQPPAPPRP